MAGGAAISSAQRQMHDLGIWLIRRNHLVNGIVFHPHRVFGDYGNIFKTTVSADLLGFSNIAAYLEKIQT